MSSLLSPSAPLLGRRRLDLAYPSASPRRGGLHCPQPIKALSSADPPKETPVKTTTEATQPPAPSPPKRPVYSMKKGQIVRVDKEKYLSSINYLSVDHPPYYKGLDYIYEDRGEVLDLRIFETGEYAL
ncbi:NAD(P)H-quinone oxidoreductase subunit O, chloroplastic isoform X3 [Curcuma longa]